MVKTTTSHIWIFIWNSLMVRKYTFDIYACHQSYTRHSQSATHVYRYKDCFNIVFAPKKWKKARENKMMKQNTIGILHAQWANMNAEPVRLIDVVGDWDVCQFSPLALQCRKFIYSSFTHVVIANSNTHTKNNWFLIWSSPSTHVEMGRLRIASSKIIKTSDIQIMNHQTAVPCVNSIWSALFFPPSTTQYLGSSSSSRSSIIYIFCGIWYTG